MALHRTAAALAAAATLIVSAGCDNLSFRRLDYDNTEAVRINSIRVLPGAGDVTVRAIGAQDEVRIKRVVRYQGGQPDTTYEVKGGELVLDTDCGSRCSISYEVTAPDGVSVKGETGSGDVDLSRVGPVEMRLGSGNIRVTASSGPVRAETGSGNIQVAGAGGPVRAQTGSGNVEVDEVAAAVTLRTSSGDITGHRLGGGVDAETGSGDIAVDLTTPASARVHASSGSVDLVVPTGRYRVRSNTDGGDAELGVTDDPSATLVLDLSTGSGDITVTQR
ncbi:DUF4097 family beta strand repeat-containing protein [Micromonospora sp. DSM 115977]|uniref:DUF4097 family beta strand repeat-containing protein n=1 Tax=Micromonospora reichwaldensis TaxID=3075516 RepID=A0ABU2X1H0_9ACTN|nr:DUF4097 family beta strand repeat-containing protein [Micromonospora sp. DSM 115977]MDT0532019.1 DUF4097 family beta strand repeat-containing protein [Micromonospora sp. DSM 115977]